MKIIDTPYEIIKPQSTTHITVELQPSDHIIVTLPSGKSLLVSADGTITQE